MDELAEPVPRPTPSPTGPYRSLSARIFSREAAAMLGRNTVVSCVAFVLDLLLLWALVRWAGWGKLEAAALGFVVANTLHYALGRSWIFAAPSAGSPAATSIF